MEDVHFALKIVMMYHVFIVIIINNLVFRIRINLKTNQANKKKKAKNVLESLDQSDEIYMFKNLQDELLNTLVLRGIKNISKYFRKNH